MFRKTMICLVVAVSALTMTNASVNAQQYPPAPPAYTAPSFLWNERSFALALRARMFANTMERRGYIVQVTRVGFFNWSVRYRQA